MARILVQARMTALQSPLEFLMAATAAARKITATASLLRSRMLTSIDTRARERREVRDIDEVEVEDDLRILKKDKSLLNTTLSNCKTGEFANKLDEEVEAL